MGAGEPRPKGGGSGLWGQGEAYRWLHFLYEHRRTLSRRVLPLVLVSLITAARSGCSLLAPGSSGGRPAAVPGYRVAKEVPLPGDISRWDYQTYDASATACTSPTWVPAGSSSSTPGSRGRWPLWAASTSPRHGPRAGPGPPLRLGDRPQPGRRCRHLDAEGPAGHRRRPLPGRRTRLNWERMRRLRAKRLPPARVLHRSLMLGSTPPPEAGAQCVSSACSDLCGGLAAKSVREHPTTSQTLTEGSAHRALPVGGAPARFPVFSRRARTR